MSIFGQAPSTAESEIVFAASAISRSQLPENHPPVKTNLAQGGAAPNGYRAQRPNLSTFEFLPFTPFKLPTVVTRVSAWHQNTSRVGGQPPGKPLGLAAHSSGRQQPIAPFGSLIRAEMSHRKHSAGWMVLPVKRRVLMLAQRHASAVVKPVIPLGH
ncbi:hypothetical protein HaLaN_32573 [Haematococcus lacustris]|uniref:Uncharacterized protein n=1 Tax=Haematococcus lacustris TaxID=44745 RepID=A0A6A0AL78_HAELA|nr:hypothetical protein HaLaN_32573 [Haematococcus lacustris]